LGKKLEDKLNRLLNQDIQIESLVEPGYCRVLTQGDIPDFIPESIRTKCEGAYVAARASDDGNVYIMCDLHRVDQKASCIDREPLLAIVTSGGAFSYATFVHHGDWEGRSFNPGQEYWEKVKASGIGTYYNSGIDAGAEVIPLEDMPEGEEQTFEAIIDRIMKSYV